MRKFVVSCLNVLPITYLLLGSFFFVACSTSQRIQISNEDAKKPEKFLEDLLNQHPQYFDSIIINHDSLRVQLIYSQIDRKKNNKPVFTHHTFNPDQKYFYPASTIKLPIALLALEKLRGLNKHRVDRYSAMITETDYSGQTAVYNDPTASDGKPTVAHYIEKIFSVSDNDASNRLYEFLGQEYLNKQLHKKKYRSAEILHRLSVTMNEDQNRHTNPIKFLNDTGAIAYQQSGKFSLARFEERKILLGNGYINNDRLVMEPFNFSKKNKVSLADLHTILQSFLFPRSLRRRQRFKIFVDDRKFLLQQMSHSPMDTTTSPNQIRVFNKTGGAYGFLTDVSYVVDFDKGIEFMLSATIYCNNDGIFNDDKYDYETIGYPFMKNLREVIYDLESKRSRARVPDLTEFNTTPNN
jgi:hypothetical protein